LTKFSWEGGGWKIRVRVFFIFWKKIQGFPRALSQIQWGRGGKSDPECLKFWRKNSKAPRGHLAKFSGGGGGKIRQSV